MDTSRLIYSSLDSPLNVGEAAATSRARVDLLFMQQRMGLSEVSGLYLRDAIFLDEALRA